MKTYKTSTQFISTAQLNLKAPHSMKPKGLVIHETGNNAPAQNERDYLARNGNEVGFHVVVDGTQAIECIPFNRNAWHVGDGTGINSGNRTTIGLEIAYQTGTDSQYRAAVDVAIMYAADVLKQYGWGTDKLSRHRDWNGKDCPRGINHGRYLNWSQFKQRVQERLNELNGAKPTPPKPSKDLGKYKHLIGRDVNKDAIGVLVYYSPHGLTSEYLRAINVYSYDKLVLGKFDTTNFHDIVTLGSPDRGATDNKNRPTHRFKKGEVLQGKFLPV